MLHVAPRRMSGILVYAALSVCLLVGRSSATEVFMGEEEVRELANEVGEMWKHAWTGYMNHAWPRDELLPRECKGIDTYGGVGVTAVDALDTMAVIQYATAGSGAPLGDDDGCEFRRTVAAVCETLEPANIHEPVSVFETNIRVMGGLLGAHFVAVNDSLGFYNRPENSEVACDAPAVYNDCLLTRAVELGDALIKAFDTPTGMPYGTVNLAEGVPKGEVDVTAVACAGTFSLEFGVLSALTGNSSYEDAARRANDKLWDSRSKLGLLGNHINITEPKWMYSYASVGGSSDSFYEYLYKSGIYFGDVQALERFEEIYQALETHTKVDGHYVGVSMGAGSVTWPIQDSLTAFWPGLQALSGHLEDAIANGNAYHALWTTYDFMPEGYNYRTKAVDPKHSHYALRPELAESAYMLWRATGDPFWRVVGRDMIRSIHRKTKTECGFAPVHNVMTGELGRGAMDSYFLAETLKYLFLLFDADSDPGSTTSHLGNWVNRGHYVFNTEAHPFPMRPEWIDRYSDDASADLRSSSFSCPIQDMASKLSGLDLAFKDIA